MVFDQCPDGHVLDSELKQDLEFTKVTIRNYSLTHQELQAATYYRQSSDLDTV